MKPIVPHGYAVPLEDLKRLTEELRAARAAELANASAQERIRIEEKIKKEVRKKFKPLPHLWHIL